MANKHNAPIVIGDFNLEFTPHARVKPLFVDIDDWLPHLTDSLQSDSPRQVRSLDGIFVDGSAQPLRRLVEMAK